MFAAVTAPFVVPVLTGTCGFVAASIPPKGGTTNTVCKKSQPLRDKAASPLALAIHEQELEI